MIIKNKVSSTSSVSVRLKARETGFTIHKLSSSDWFKRNDLESIHHSDDAALMSGKTRSSWSDITTTIIIFVFIVEGLRQRWKRQRWKRWHSPISFLWSD